ncbi:MAG: glycosyltransferase family 39 protein [Chloroflexi bacterium]|nr:glycosyltransferase family 39 protein [Chloroflexota bacterium]
MTALTELVAGAAAPARTWVFTGTHWARRAALGAIVLLAAALRLFNLAGLGYANHYYTAAVVSMLQSWSNFFFAVAEPGGAVTVDKPPVGLWLQAASAYLFGVNGFAVLLPQIAAGILSVVVVYHLVRRSFGTAAGLLAALALAITPVSVATDRNNTIDSTLILTLLLATWAFIKATESTRIRWLLAGVAMVGVGFNIKMLEAYLPLPAFYAMYFLGAPERLWRKTAKLAAATVVLLIVSLSWAVAVDLIPANDRPYVGSSSDNSELSLILGYNGVQRLLGMGGRGGALSGLFGGNNTRGGLPQGQPGQAPNGGFQPPQNGMGPNGNLPRDGANTTPLQPRPPARNGGPLPQGQTPGAFQPPQGGTGGLPPQQNGNRGTPGGGPGGLGGGFPGTGQPGAQRLFTAPLSKEASWLLPFGISGMLLLLAGARLRWPVGAKHQALLLWGGWLVTAGVFFSVAGFFHEYYLSTLAPPLAALVGIAAGELWALRHRSASLAAAWLAAAAGVTLWLQYNTVAAYMRSIGWLPVVAVLAALGVLALLASLVRRTERMAAAGFVCIVAAMLVTPAIWSGLTTLNSSGNQSLPAAYDGRSNGPALGGGLQVDPKLLAFLQANTQSNRYMMAVPSSMQGADYVIATGRPVLYLGGFNGNDQVLSASELAQMVAGGELRYIYWGGPGGPGVGGQANLSSWVTAHCKAVQGYETQTQNAGAPDGTLPGGANMGTDGGGFGPMRVSLYDCKN